MDAAILDQAHFDHMTGSDRPLQLEVLGLFRGQAVQWADAIIEDAPKSSWRDIVHTLKGSARGIGLMRLAAACERAERAEGGDISDALADLRATLAEALSAADAFASQ